MTTSTPAFRLRDIALTAYAPTVVSSTGHGAVMPVLALRARDTGDSAVAVGYVAAMLSNFAHLDPATREAMLPLMFELFGQDIQPFYDMDLTEAAAILLSGL